MNCIGMRLFAAFWSGCVCAFDSKMRKDRKKESNHITYHKRNHKMTNNRTWNGKTAQVHRTHSHIFTRISKRKPKCKNERYTFCCAKHGRQWIVTAVIVIVVIQTILILGRCESEKEEETDTIPRIHLLYLYYCNKLILERQKFNQLIWIIYCGYPFFTSDCENFATPFGYAYKQ